jgi:hypothetical protein
MLTPLVSSTNILNPNIAWNNSWVPVGNDQGIPFYAQASYNVNLLGQSGFVFTDATTQVNGSFSTIQMVSATKFSGLTAVNSTIGNLTNYEFAAGTSLNAPITNFKLSYGAVIAYKL